MSTLLLLSHNLKYPPVCFSIFGLIVSRYTGPENELE